MGFFSWNCPGCDNSIRHRGACTPTSAWMSLAVYLDKDGNTVRGTYDGYGRLGPLTLGYGEKFTLWHEACHEVMGKPGYSKPSRSAHDQGHFVGDYDPPKPTCIDHLADMRVRAEREREASRRAWERALEEAERARADK